SRERRVFAMTEIESKFRACPICMKFLPLDQFRDDDEVCVHCRDARTSPIMSTKSRGRFMILSRDDFQCFYCGRSAYKERVELVIDHVVPVTLGGDDDAGNLVTACRQCNAEKSGNRLDPDLEKDLLD